MSETFENTAFNERASSDERVDALGQLMANVRPADSDVREVIDYITDDLQDQQFRKALTNNKVVPFPTNKKNKHGMQSVEYDEMQIQINGEYIERPGVLSFDSMRAMVNQTPVLSSIIMTRLRQVDRFCRVQESGQGEGFAIRHKDRSHELSDGESKSIMTLQDFFSNCGWENNPRRRRQLRRDSFSQFMKKAVRDTLTLDSCAIETEFRRNKNLGLDGMYAVDGSTIRLCTEEGYRGDDEIFALQVVQGAVRTAYTFDDLIYEPRNPTTDVLSGGYGMSEVELLVKTVTGYLNALTYNQRYFDSNSIPKGILHLSGDFSERDVTAFKRYWNSMIKGVNNAWTLPVMVSKDQESRAAFDRIDAGADEMMFSRWMTFLTAICCAVFGMDPAEINSDAFSPGNSPLSGDDTSERLAAAKDKGLRPLLSYFENLFTDYVVQTFSDKYVFRWTGLDREDEDKRHEMRKLTLTINEARAQEGQEPMDGPLGDAPLNPSLVGPWMQINGVGGQAPGDEQGGGDYGQESQEDDNQPGANGQNEPEEPEEGAAPEEGRENQGGKEGSPEEAEQALEKSLADAERFGMPRLKIWGPGA